MIERYEKVPNVLTSAMVSAFTELRMTGHGGAEAKVLFAAY
jgi:hypothetical protein